MDQIQQCRVLVYECLPGTEIPNEGKKPFVFLQKKVNDGCLLCDVK